MPTLHDPVSAAAQLTALITRVRRRTRLRDVMIAIAFGLLVIAGIVFATRWSSWPVLLRGMASAAIAAAVVAVVMRSRRDGRSAPAAARRIERRYATLRNLAVTAEELMAAPDRARPYMRDRVMQEAARATAGVDPARVVPIASAAAGAIAAGIVATMAWTFAVAPPRPQTQAQRVEGALRNQGLDVDVVIEPPAYTNRPATRLRNPGSIDALSGSTATISASGTNAAVRVNGVAVPLQQDGLRRALLVESGYVAIDTANDHRVLPLTVRPDAKPDVRVTAPGKDLRVADARGTIAIHATASDDLDLRSLEVRYTVVSGGGEQFTFVEGTLPVAIAKESGRAWHADAAPASPGRRSAATAR